MTTEEAIATIKQLSPYSSVEPFPDFAVEAIIMAIRALRDNDAKVIVHVGDRAYARGYRHGRKSLDASDIKTILQIAERESDPEKIVEEFYKLEL